jgi:endoglycosylceramidase
MSSLSVADERFVDDGGRQVVLRGANAGGRSKLPPFYPFELEPDFNAALSRYVDVLKSLGSNVVRLLIIHEAAEPVRGQYDEGYLTHYDRMVTAFTQRGMRVIIDSHQDVFSRRFCGDGFPDWMLPERYRNRPHRSDCKIWELRYWTRATMQSFGRFWSNEDGIRDRYIELFRMLADRYCDQPAVIGFEPMNEPFPGWPGIVRYATWHRDQLYPFYEGVGRAVQSVDERYLLFSDISPLENMGIWNASRKRPEVSNLVLAPHYYDLGYLRVLWFHPGGGPETMRKGLKKHLELARAWNVPTFVGEFGVSMHREDADEYLTRLYTVFDELHLSGTIWEASMSPLLWNLRNKGILEADGSPKPPTLAVDRPYPRAVAGVIETFTFHPGNRQFDLVWSESPEIGSPTEVYLPPRLYPGEPRIDPEPASAFRLDPDSGLLEVDPLGRKVRRRLTVTPR